MLEWVFGIFLGRVYALFHFLGFIQNRQINSGLQIFVRTHDDGKRIPVVIEPDWTIGTLKENILKDKSRENVKIIFQGKVLKDEVQISDCDLGSQSILDAVVVKFVEKRAQRSEPDPAPSEPLCESLLDLQLTEEERKSEAHSEDKAHFFVYCSTCKRYRPGKLRVRCRNCHSGAIIVHNDPCNWDDVLEPDRILGFCETSCCAGKTVFAEFYFKCGSNCSSGEGTCPPLYLIKSNIKKVPCLACTEIQDPVLVFECQSRHVICIECFRDFCISRLNERQFILDPEVGYTLACPVNCPDNLIRDTKHFHLLDPEQYERYQRFAAEEFVLQSGGVLCPQPGCGMGIIPEAEPCNRVTCNSCHYVFCRRCLQGFHIGDCQNVENTQPSGFSASRFSVDESRTNSARWELSEDQISSVTIRVISKPCPKCRTPTERDGGCMHMSCTKAGCGFSWCWICQTEWTRNCMASHWFG